MSCAAIESELVVGIKRTLMKGIDARIRASYSSQYHAEDELNIPQETISRLHSGKDERFSIVWLLLTAERVGAKISIVVE